mgnify:CR=1 FL=1
MNEAVQQAKDAVDGHEGVKLEAEVPKDWHDGVVVEMEKGKVVKLLPQHKEDGVEKVEELGHPVPPTHAKLPHRPWTAVALVGVVPDQKPPPVVAVGDDQVGKVGVADGHAEVVDDDEWLQVVKRCSVGHQSGAQGEGKVEEEGHDGEDRVGRAGHQRKVRSARILHIVPELVEVVGS